MWAAIIVAVTLLGRWAFSVDTHAQEGDGPRPTVTPTSLLDEEDDGEKKKKEVPPDCSDPGNAGYPECAGYRAPTPTPEPTPTMRPGECSPFDDDCSPPQRPTATKVPGNSCPPHQTCVTPELTEETEDDTPLRPRTRQRHLAEAAVRRRTLNRLLGAPRRRLSGHRRRRQYRIVL